MSELIVRRIRADEWPAFKALRLAALQDAPLAFGSTYAEQSRFGDDHWQRRASDGATSRGSALFVADGGGLRGMAWGVSADDRPGAAYLYGMFVDPGARGRGVGRQLVERVCAWASAGGHQRLVLDVTETNAPAIALYENTGFIRTGATKPLPHAPAIMELEMERAL